LTELIHTDAPSTRAADILIGAGLPRAFLLDQERLDDEINILTADFDEPGSGQGVQPDEVKAKL